MASTAKDPRFAADQVKLVRKTLRLTLEQLADAAGLTIIAIEKAESGRHRIDESSLRAIGRAIRVDLDFFESPQTEEQTARQADVWRRLRKSVLTPLAALRSAAAVMRLMEERRHYRLEASAGADSAASEAILDAFRGLDARWADMAATDRLGEAAKLAEQCQALDKDGVGCWAGVYRPRRGAPEVGLISVRPEGSAAISPFALIALEEKPSA